MESVSETLNTLNAGEPKYRQMDYTTHEPTTFQKVLQVYWFNPKSWLLKRFQVEGETIHIETMNGAVFTAPLEKCVFRYQRDDYERHEIWVKTESEKIHFKEIPFMLEDEEWDDIVDFCINATDSKETILSKLMPKYLTRQVLKGGI